MINELTLISIIDVTAIPMTCAANDKIIEKPKNIKNL